MQKFFKLLMLFCVFKSAASPWSLDFKGGVGPAWHNFFSAESYKIAPGNEEVITADIQTIKTAFDVMPFVQASAQVGYKDWFTAKIIGAGGSLNNGSAIIGYYSPVVLISPEDLNFMRAPSLGVKVAFADMECGLHWSNCPKTIESVFLVGYITNRERLSFNFESSVMHFCMKNTWRGPYIGLKVEGVIFPDVRFSVLYKAVFGSLISNFRLSYPPSFFVPSALPGTLYDPNGSSSDRYSPAIGSIFNAEWLYQVNNYCCVGTDIEYFQYRNYKKGCVKLGPNPLDALVNNKVITGACLKKIRWQQVMWTFFVQFTF